MTAAPRAAIYARISRDREGAGLGVDRQEADCRALAERLGWDVVATYVDNDISAYSGKVRPQYRAMLDAVRTGQIQGILAWHPDRLHRRNVELESFVTLVEVHGLQVQTVASGEVNLSTPDGRMFARMLGAAAQREIEHGRDRIRRAKAQAAEQGRYRGGRRPFGYHKDGVTVRKKEAEALQHAADALLVGRTLKAVADDLNQRGSKTSTAKPWTRDALRAVLLRPRNAGLIHTGSVTSPTILGPATWPPILEAEQWRAVHALLTQPGRRTQTSSDPAWLGSGIYLCSLCEATMRVCGVGDTPSRPNHKRQHHYRCIERAHLTIHQQHTDDYVLEVVAKLVRDPRVVQAMTAGETDALTGDRERRTLLLTRLEQVESDYDDGLIDGRRLKAASARLTDELVEVEARLADGVQSAQVSPIFAEVDPGQAFLGAPIDIQRAVLRSVLRVEVVKADRKGVAWTKDRLRLSPVTS